MPFQPILLPESKTELTFPNLLTHSCRNQINKDSETGLDLVLAFHSIFRILKKRTDPTISIKNNKDEDFRSNNSKNYRYSLSRGNGSR